MGISKISYGSGENLFEISYKDDEVITETGGNSFTSDNFVANTFAAYQNRSQTQFFTTGDDSSYNKANEDNCMWQKWNNNNKTDLLPGADNPDGYYTFNSLLTSRNGLRIITELTDIQRVIWTPNVAENVINTRINGTAVSVTTYGINTATNQPQCAIIDATNPSHYTAQNVFIAPWLLYPQNKKELQLHYRREDGLSPWGGSATRISGARNNVNNRARTYPLSTAMVNYDVPTGNNQTFGFYSDDNNYLFACTLSTNNYASGYVNCYICSEDELKKWLASSGLKFIYKGRMYKPVAENNVIVGYTDDLSSQSEWDNWHTKDDHEKPVTPPPPPSPTGDKDDMDLTEIGFTSSIGGAAFYWVFNSPPTGVFDDFNEHAPEGSMLSQNILSCYCSALNYAWHTVNQKIVIYTNGSQTPAYESTNAYPLIYNDKNPHFIVGKFDVPRRTNTFYDFSPYTTYELFIPFCGWMGLPDTVAGRSVRVYMDCDVSTCTCKAIVMLESEGGETIIGEITGNFGAPCPIQVVEGGLYKQAAINSGLQIASGVASGIYGASAGAGALAISGFSNALQGLHNLHAAGNTNYGQTIGRAGDCSNLAGGHYCKIRITHPVVDEVVNNSMFGHTVGYLCNTVGKLSSFSGFTVCINPHITGIECTDEEKEEIKRLLENGVIL